MTACFNVGRRKVGHGAPCFLIAEIGLAHDGSLGAAHAYIDAAAEAGVDAVKFQTHIATEESTTQEAFRVNVFPQDKTRYEYWQRTSFSEVQWGELKRHAEDRELEFLSTPFSVAAVQLLRRIGVKAWKIGSGETNNLLLLEAVALQQEPVLLSTGMSFMEEIAKSVQLLRTRAAPVLLMQCTNFYPCPPEHLGLNMLEEYSTRYGVPVGFSDHSGEIAPGLAAATLGADAVEVHVTWHKACFGPDVKASLTFEQLAELTKGVRLIERALTNAVDKDAMAGRMEDVRRLFTKGLVAKQDMPAGTTVGRAHIDAKKPCAGVSAAEYEQILGRRTTRALKKDEYLQWSDLE